MTLWNETVVLLQYYPYKYIAVDALNERQFET